MLSEIPPDLLTDPKYPVMPGVSGDSEDFLTTFAKFTDNAANELWIGAQNVLGYLTVPDEIGQPVFLSQKADSASCGLIHHLEAFTLTLNRRSRPYKTGMGAYPRRECRKWRDSQPLATNRTYAGPGCQRICDLW